MSIEATVSLLVQQQEKILNIFNAKIEEWDNKIDGDGGILKGDLFFTDFGIIDIKKERFGFGTVNPTDLFTVKAPNIDDDTIISFQSNQKGTTILKLGVDDLFDPEKIHEHGSLIELHSALSKTELIKNPDSSFNINHDSTAGLFITADKAVDIEFLTDKKSRLKICKDTGNILINTTKDLDDHTLQINGTVSVVKSLLLGEGLQFKTTDPIITQTVDSSYIRFCGGNKWIENGASILLTGKNEPNKPFTFQVHTTPLGSPSLIIDSQKSATFSGKLTAPMIQFESTMINGAMSLPQILFKDDTQPANNRVWQIRTEDKEFIIRTLDDNGNPGYKELRIVRSPTSNDMTQVIFGDLNDITLDMVSSTVNINNLKIIGRRQTGWKNITNISNTSKDLQSISSDNSELAKIVRGLVNDLISHGLIGL